MFNFIPPSAIVVALGYCLVFTANDVLAGDIEDIDVAMYDEAYAIEQPVIHKVTVEEDFDFDPDRDLIEMEDCNQ